MATRGWITAAALATVTMTACSGGTSGGGTSPEPNSPAPSSPASPTALATTASATPTATSDMAGWTPPPVVAPPAGATPVPGSDQRASGVVRVQVNNCVGLAQASGFFVADDLVLTAAPAFEDASTISVHSSNGVVRGQLVGIDKPAGVALVKVLPTGDGSRLTGHVFPLATGAPALGAAVTQLAHPLGHPLHQARGTVSAVEADAFTHSADTAPGTSGGVLLDSGNRAVGMELAADPKGTEQARAVPMSVVKPLVAKWQASPKPQKFAACEEVGPPSMTSIHPDAPAIKASLTRYLWGLSNPDARDAGGLTGKQVAWQKLGAAEQRRLGSPDAMMKELGGATIAGANVDNLEVRDHFTDTLLWTLQTDGPAGKCTVYTQKLVLSTRPGHWVVDNVQDVKPPVSC